jgi:hypothetical protein
MIIVIAARVVVFEIKLDNVSRREASSNSVVVAHRYLAVVILGSQDGVVNWCVIVCHSHH